MVETVLFDLDGTLTDPFLGITNSFYYALEKLGIPAPQRETMKTLIGPPLRDGFRTRFGVAEENIEHAVALYREHFSVTGLYENTVYPGVPEMLEALKSNGKRMAVATNKAAVYAQKILDHFGLLPYFDFVSGSELDGRRGTKPEAIRYALENLGTQPAGAIIVGDRNIDILGAKETGLHSSIAVLYGYGSRDELEAAGATVFAETAEDIVKLLI